MTIQLNGQEREVPEGLNLRELLDRLGLGTDRLAVERNLEVVPRAQWESTRIEPGDRLEVVNLVGGGSPPDGETRARLRRRLSPKGFGPRRPRAVRRIP